MLHQPNSMPPLRLLLKEYLLDAVEVVVMMVHLVVWRVAAKKKQQQRHRRLHSSNLNAMLVGLSCFCHNSPVNYIFLSLSKRLTPVLVVL